MDEDWRNAFGISMCTEICDGAGAKICDARCDGAPSTCSTFMIFFTYKITNIIHNITATLFAAASTVITTRSETLLVYNYLI